jgi:signal transduction histidine kinase
MKKNLKRKKNPKHILNYVGILLLLFCTLNINIDLAKSQSPITLKLKVGAYENSPKIYSDANGKFVGFFPTLLGYMAEKESWELEYVNGTWTECLDRLEKGEIDMMVDVAYSESRALIYDFNNNSVFNNWGIIYTDLDTTLDSFLDLEGKTVAVMNKSTHTVGENGIISLITSFEIQCTLHYVSNYQQVFEAIDSGIAETGIVNRLFGKTFENDYDVKSTSLIFNPRELRLAFPKGAALNDLLIPKIDTYIVELKNDPTSVYHDAVAEMLGETTRGTYELPTWIVPLIISLILGIIGTIGFSAFFRRKSEYYRNLRRDLLEKQKQMEQLQKDLMLMISHQLRTPISGINLTMSNFLKYRSKLKVSQQEKMFKLMSQECKKLHHMVEKVEFFTSLPVFSAKTSLQEVNLSDTMNQIILDLEDETSKNSNKIVLINENANNPIEINESVFVYVLKLIIENAIKFSKQNDDINIEIHLNDKKYLSKAGFNKELLLKIIDKGIGIPEEDQKQIFNKMFRASNARNITGLGLGLNIAKKLVELQKGSIFFTSTLNKGTSFSISFPVFEKPKIVKENSD